MVFLRVAQTLRVRHERMGGETMRCRNCGSKARPGRHCSGCGMLQPPRVARGLKIAVGLLSILAAVLLTAVGYVILKLEPERKTADTPPAMLAELRDAQDAAPSGTSQSVLQTQQQETTDESKAELQDAGQMPMLQAVQATADTEDDAAQTVDSEVTCIRAEYDAIEKNRNAGLYEKAMLRQSVYSYISGEEPVCIILRSGADGLDFDRSYYFQNGKLRFAYFEATDACRLYFKDDVLLRLRYAVNARRASESVDYDGTGGEEYDAWCSFALREGYALYDEAKQAAAARTEYILPDSVSRYLTEDDLRDLTAKQCQLARNEIFARHGRRFDDAVLQAYFDGCSWYTGTVAAAEFDENVFNEYETANVSFIREYERNMGYQK